MLPIAPRAVCRHPVRATHLCPNRRLHLPLGSSQRFPSPTQPPREPPPRRPSFLGSRSSDSTSITRRGSEVEARRPSNSACSWGGAGSKVSAPRTLCGHLADTHRGQFADTSRSGLCLLLGLKAVGRLAAITHVAPVTLALSKSSIRGGRAAFVHLRTPHAIATGDTTHQARSSRPGSKSSAKQSASLRPPGQIGPSAGHPSP
jgi:hypothetical protein